MEVRGHMIPGSDPSGFQKVTLNIRVVGSGPEERLEHVERLAPAGHQDTTPSGIPFPSRAGCWWSGPRRGAWESSGWLGRQEERPWDFP
jgi:hypothetical protein